MGVLWAHLGAIGCIGLNKQASMYIALSLYQPVDQRHICIMDVPTSSISPYMGVLIIGVNTLYTIFCLFNPLGHRQIQPSIRLPYTTISAYGTP